MKKIFLFLYIPISLLIADNEMGIYNMEVVSGDSSLMQVYVNNDDPVVAFQLNIFIPDYIDFTITSVELTDRASDHDIIFTQSASYITILCYSINSTPLFGNEGSVAEINFSSIEGNPGVYPITINEPILSSESFQC